MSARASGLEYIRAGRAGGGECLLGVVRPGPGIGAELRVPELVHACDMDLCAGPGAAAGCGGAEHQSREEATQGPQKCAGGEARVATVPAAERDSGVGGGGRCADVVLALGVDGAGLRAHPGWDPDLLFADVHDDDGRGGHCCAVFGIRSGVQADSHFRAGGHAVYVSSARPGSRWRRCRDASLGYPRTTVQLWI